MKFWNFWNTHAKTKNVETSTAYHSAEKPLSFSEQFSSRLRSFRQSLSGKKYAIPYSSSEFLSEVASAKQDRTASNLSISSDALKYYAQEARNQKIDADKTSVKSEYSITDPNLRIPTTQELIQLAVTAQARRKEVGSEQKEWNQRLNEDAMAQELQAEITLSESTFKIANLDQLRQEARIRDRKIVQGTIETFANDQVFKVQNQYYVRFGVNQYFEISPTGRILDVRSLNYFDQRQAGEINLTNLKPDLQHVESAAKIIHGLESWNFESGGYNTFDGQQLKQGRYYDKVAYYYFTNAQGEEIGQRYTDLKHLKMILARSCVGTVARVESKVLQNA
jgi:hypothetical protein